MRALALAVLALGCASTPSPLLPAFGGAVGAPHSGVQTGGVELPKRGKGFVRYRPDGPNHFGRPRLVSELVRIAAELEAAAPEGPPLVVGDLSAEFGGKIPGHQSHRTGRDVDLLFVYESPGGARVTSPGFIHVESDGLARVPDTGEILRFDVEHQWRVVRALVASKELGVQFLFVSRTVEALLVEYAIALGEPLDLVVRAQSVMLEPRDSLPHDDHVHVRIACSLEELSAGCIGGGPYWEWLPSPPTPVTWEGNALLAALAGEPALDPSPSEVAPGISGSSVGALPAAAAPEVGE